MYRPVEEGGQNGERRVAFFTCYGTPGNRSFFNGKIRLKYGRLRIALLEYEQAVRGAST